MSEAGRSADGLVGGRSKVGWIVSCTAARALHNGEPWMAAVCVATMQESRVESTRMRPCSSESVVVGGTGARWGRTEKNLGWSPWTLPVKRAFFVDWSLAHVSGHQCVVPSRNQILGTGLFQVFGVFSSDTVRFRYKRLVYKRIWVASPPFQQAEATCFSFEVNQLSLLTGTH